jgi:nitrate reductase cytochrome c-type subunit
MQKALDKMNLQIHHVISDLAGTTGLTIMDAVLAGERDPHKLAQLRHPPIRAGEETIMKSLIGDYREEPPVHVCQSLKAYRHYENSNRCLLSFALSAHLSYGIPNLSALGLWFQSCSVNTCTDTDHDAQHVVKDGSP